ncbi:trypsin-like peptidase [Nocardiopsis sp. Huas11]|uniref:S1 family peptidase n=1 Tax=Nocardiopsis sp. Huas11 TaxID=2183912 RepID=UPI000F2215B5|nr:serine protease [Nocardiopsis sp. Huas11]RKS08461.1 trypsin-like peptidase [Nocardiopsis sp. Huas11]
MADSPHVPQYMGRILTSGGTPQGTCFQIDPNGYLVTAWHVVETTLALADTPSEIAEVTVDSLGDPGIKPTRAWVVARNLRADLALLKTNTALPGSARLLRASDSAEQGEEVALVGHAVIEDMPHVPPPRSVEALGQWQGELARTDGLRLGRIQSPDVMPGMSGAPVRRRGDDSVLGVISSRHNSSDVWMTHTVWVSRTEDLLELCKGHVPARKDRWLGFAKAAAGGAAGGYTVSEYVHRHGSSDAAASSGSTASDTASEPTTSTTTDLPAADQAHGASGLSDAVTDEAAAQASESMLKKAANTVFDWLL